jgi:hypothetical protein
MFRVLIRFVKSPVYTFPVLAAAIGVLVSGYSTFNGISEIFPDFGYSILAALGLAGIIQLGMVTSTLAFRERPALRPLLGFIIVVTVLMSSFTSYVFYFRGYSEETIAKERQIERYESLRGYLADVRTQTAGALGTLREAEAELRQRIEIEEASGGGLRNLSNPYLQKLVAESDLVADLATIKSGTGERYRFLSSVLPRLQQMQTELGASLEILDAEIEGLSGDTQADQRSLRERYARASSIVAAERVREVNGEFRTTSVDAAILDTSPLEEEEYWQRAVSDLVVAHTPSAIVFAFIAIFIDLMIVFFAFIAGESQSAASQARLSLRHWLELAYGQNLTTGVGRWLAALDGARLSRNQTVLHRVDVNMLADAGDVQCQRFLRQDGYLRQVMLEDGDAHWWLTDEAYSRLIELAREAPRLQEATEPA